MKFIYNCQGEKEEVICHTRTRKIDSRSWKIMQICLEKQAEPYFLPVNITEESDGYTFYYDMHEMVNLRAWMYEATEKEQFEMRKEIGEKQQKIFQLGISQEQLITEDRYIYVDEKTQHIRFICVPVLSETGVRDDKKVSKIPDTYNIESEVKCETEPELPLMPPVPSEEFLNMERKDSEPVMPESLDFQQNVEESNEKDYIEEIKEPEDFHNIPKRNPFQEKGMQSVEKEEMDGSETILGFTQPTGVTFAEEKSVEDSDTDIEKLYEDKPVTEEQFIDETDSEDIYTDSDEDRTVLLMQKTEDDGEDKTILLRPDFQIKASLHRVRTGKTTKFKKNVTTIGKSKMRSDIIIEENPTISRKHCTIYFENGSYYLEDNGSSNGTWLDDKKIQPEEKVILRNKSKIRFSDEEFIFYIE